MGAIAEAIASFAQPLFDETDGSESQMQRAMNIAQLCWNLALLPEEKRNAAIDEYQSPLKMSDEDFAEFRHKIILPMIRRHIEKFPGLHSRSQQLRQATVAVSPPTRMYPTEHLFSSFGDASPPPMKRSAMGRYDPCPCGSGRKYKWCCGAPK
jgi:hypothetical protein